MTDDEANKQLIQKILAENDDDDDDEAFDTIIMNSLKGGIKKDCKHLHFVKYLFVTE